MSRRTIIIGSLVLCFLLVVGGLSVFLSKPDPAKLTVLSLENLNKAGSFAYSITQEQTAGGNKRLLTRISGYKSGENIQIQGQLAGSEVQMIKIKDTLYNKDPFSKEWVMFNDLSVVQKVFLVELDPLATLQLKEMGEVMLKGKEEVNGRDCWVCTLKPSVQNQMLERFWTDFEYTLYIAQNNRTVSKAEVKAKNKESKEPMTMILEFNDIGRKISIQPPETFK